MADLKTVELIEEITVSDVVVVVTTPEIIVPASKPKEDAVNALTVIFGVPVSP